MDLTTAGRSGFGRKAGEKSRRYLENQNLHSGDYRYEN